MGAEITAADTTALNCTIRFDISTDYCHSGDIVQGGFVTAMLDAAMSHAAFALEDNILNIASLEIKTTFLEPSRAGVFNATGKLLKVGRSIGFMSGELFNDDGVLTATATTTAKLVRAR
ncbi:PaaI family thioesterase [Halieaceae bacterium IMCC14734]|uniref:PaaI family thioesterase n=2 Tax=Candidatus Litorirhabdus singularis TaxID=2518993 RepID=A0ABT3TCM4_9GAMM|nr:PaaI family thioesterase [Candidatus Litorirhabdus singularis]